MSARVVIGAGVIALLVSSCAMGDSPSASTVTTTTGAAPGSTTPVATSTTVPPSSLTTTATTRPASWSDDLADFVARQVAAGAFSGAALLARDEKVVWRYASDLANRDENQPNQVDTKFNLGSMNKMFTAVATLQLAETATLDLDDTIADVLPGYPNSAVAEVVTIHHLLTHTSGLGDTFTAQFAENPNSYRSNSDYLTLFADDPLLFDPGESFAYSNAGNVVLGLIIEEISGQDYYTYVRDNIFSPAGMMDTGSYALEEDVAGVAMGYTTMDIDGNDTGVLAANAPLMPGRGFAAGGGYSTVDDLFRFRNSLLGYELLTAEFTDRLFDGQAELAPGVEYGYGFIIREKEGSVGHSGGAPGICSTFSMYPESGHTLVVLSNSDDDCIAVLDYVRSHPPGWFSVPDPSSAIEGFATKLMQSGPLLACAS